MERLPYLLTVVLTILVLMFFNSISQAQTSFNISNKTTGDTLLHIDNDGKVGIGTTSPTAELHVERINGVLFTGSYGSGAIPIEGAGTRMMWYPRKAAFRSGYINGTQWDDINIGYFSTAMGFGATASGEVSTAMGINTRASGAYSTAIGNSTTASGNFSTAIGREIEANGDYTVAVALSDQNGLQVTQDSTMAIMGGKVGIGTVSPATSLEVADTIYSSLGGFKFPDGTIQGTAATGSSGNTLDQAYDEGGTGEGRTITADAGAFEVNGVDGVFFSGNFGSGTIPATGAGVRMMWYPHKAAFRAGMVGSTQWDDANIGDYSTAMGVNTIASGGISTAMGIETTASGGQATAMGYQTTASDLNSTAMGQGSIASGPASMAMGNGTIASGESSTAMGLGSIASGRTSTAMGRLTRASGLNSTAIGREIEANGDNTVAIALSDQTGVIVTQDNTMAIMGGKVGIDEIAPTAELQVGGIDGVLFTGTFGSGTIPASGVGTRMMWYPAKAAFRAGHSPGNNWDDGNIGEYSFASGYHTRASGLYSTAMGEGARADGLGSTAMGYLTYASNHASTAMGGGTMATGTYSTAMGNDTDAYGDYSTAMGVGTTAHGSFSTAMGAGTEAVGDASTAMGYSTNASGQYSTAMGYNTWAVGNYSTAMGEQIRANGSHTVAIALSNQNGLSVTQANTMAIIGGKVGIDEIAPTAELQVGGTDGALFTGNYGSGTLPATGAGTRMMWYPSKVAFRVGYVDGTQWDDANIGDYSMAMGYGTIASNLYSIAMGAASTASGHASTAMGRSADATGTGSVALGDYTEASGSASTALGRSTIASGGYSSAMGAYINTSGTGSFAIGDYSTTSAPTFTNDNHFYARFANGYALYTSSNLSSGVRLIAGANSWSIISDSTKKENFKNIDGEEFLNKISQFKLTSWNYKGQDPTQYRHYGPMAQDFYAAFGNDGIGTIGNDTTIASANFDGINFIAIQALEKRTTQLNEKINEISDLKKDNQQLKEEMFLLKSKIEKLESLFSKVEEVTEPKNNQYARNKDNLK